MEPLIFKIETQADDSGVRKYEKSLNDVNISSKKASGALKSFVQDIAQARDGTDVASAALGAFSRVLGSSLAGTGIIIAGKALIDAFAKIDEAVKESEKAVSEAFAGMDRAGKAMSFAEAVGQAKNFEGVAENIRKKIKEINDSPFTSIIDNITQSTKLMDIQATMAENQAREIKRMGAESELAHLKRMQGLDAENKALELNSRALEKELDGIDAIKESETALAITRKYQLQADEIRSKFADERSKFADERSKKDAENAEKRQKEIEAQIKAEKELAEVQQKRFNDLYDAEIKAQEATQKRIDANNKAEQEAATKATGLAGDVATAKEEQQRRVGGSALDITRAGTGGSARTGSRETSFEMGLRLSGERAYSQGQRIEADRVKQETANRINAEIAARGESRRVQPESVEVQNRLKQEFVQQRGAEGEASFGTKQAREATVQATQASSDFAKTQNEASQASSFFESNLSDMGTGFDQAMSSASNFANGIIESGGNIIDNFLMAGQESSNLGDKMGDATDSVNKFSKELEKATTAGGAGAGQGGGGKETGSLSSIEELLKKNFDELKAYAHAT
jgi:hypothetical protein